MRRLFTPTVVGILILSGCDALVSRPDRVVYIPAGWGGPDSTNQHFIVVPTPKRTFLAFVPVFFEACFWILELYREEGRLVKPTQPDTITLPADVETD